MSNTCGTCRFFGTDSGYEYYDPEANDGDGDDVVTEHHYCARIIHGNGHPRPSKLSAEPAFVTDGSGYSARLRVLPTFGCVLHEPAMPRQSGTKEDT